MSSTLSEIYYKKHAYQLIGYSVGREIKRERKKEVWNPFGSQILKKKKKDTINIRTGHKNIPNGVLLCL